MRPEAAEGTVNRYIEIIFPDMMGFVENMGHGSINLVFQDGRLVMVDSTNKRKIPPVNATINHSEKQAPLRCEPEAKMAARNLR